MEATGQGGGWRPIPDPTLLTTEQLLREINQLRLLLGAQIKVLDTKMTGHFLIDAERFTKIEERFRTIEAQRVEQKHDTQEALNAALASQKEAVTKADAVTKETLHGLAELSRTTATALENRLGDLKERVDRGDANVTGRREGAGAVGNAAYLVAVLVVAVISVVVVYATHHTASMSPAVVCTAAYHPAPCP